MNIRQKLADHHVEMILENQRLKREARAVDFHSTWFKRVFNPPLRKIFGVEICSILADDRVIGYGIRRVISL